MIILCLQKTFLSFFPILHPTRLQISYCMASPSLLKEKTFIFKSSTWDSKLINSEEGEALFLSLLEEKITLLEHIDLIITFDDNALFFIDKYYETLFGPNSTGSIPIVFSGCNDYLSAEAIYHSRSNIAGRLEPSSRIKTIDVATKLIPDYNSITVLVDNSTTAQGVMAQLIAENTQQYPLTFINSTDYSFSDLAVRLSQLTPKDIFLFVACYQDSTGAKMTYSQSANFVYTTLNTPIFCTTSYNVDTIFAGGYVLDKTQSGYQTGLIARAILYEGASIESFGLSRDADANMAYMFNVDVLSSFNIGTSAIPQEALRIHNSSTILATNADLDLQRHLIVLSIFLGISIFIIAGFALIRHNKAREHEQIALTDALTCAGSRIALESKLDILIQYCLDANVSSTLVFVDIDGFKSFNDRYGHPTGDAILKQVIRRIQSALSKKSDVYRYGGDEFIILMRMPANEAKYEIKQIISGFKKKFQHDDQSFTIHISMGSVEIPGDGTDAETLISKADTAMYAAKTFNATRNIFYSNLH